MAAAEPAGPERPAAPRGAAGARGVVDGHRAGGARAGGGDGGDLGTGVHVHDDGQGVLLPAVVPVRDVRAAGLCGGVRGVRDQVPRGAPAVAEGEGHGLLLRLRLGGVLPGAGAARDGR